MDSRYDKWPTKLWVALGAIVLMVERAIASLRTSDVHTERGLSDVCASIFAGGVLGAAIGWVIGKAIEVFIVKRK